MDFLASAFSCGLVKPRSIADLEGRNSTRVKLMTAAERTFGEQGLHSVSLQSLAVHAGQANKYAVQYHFGSREEIINAVFAVRFTAIEERRRYYLEIANEREAEISLETIGTIIMLSFAEQVGDGGRQSFARFFLQFLIQFSPWEGIPYPIKDKKSISVKLLEIIARHFPGCDRERLLRRTSLLAHLPLIALIEGQNLAAEKHERFSVEKTLRDVVAVWAAALRTP
jgi:AcrR family transcriptional regulator